MMYDVCEYCGCTLDHGEKCDCQKETLVVEDGSGGNEGMTLSDIKRPGAISRGREK